MLQTVTNSIWWFCVSSIWLSHEDPVYWFIDRHICQGSFNDRVLWHGCSAIKVLYKVQHSKGPCLCGRKWGQPHFKVKGDCVPLSAQPVSLKRWFSSLIPVDGLVQDNVGLVLDSQLEASAFKLHVRSGLPVGLGTMAHPLPARYRYLN